MFIKYFEVDLKKNTNYIFPECCVICGNKGGEEQIEFEGGYRGYHSAWKNFFSNSSKIAIPAHIECKKNLKKKERIHLAVLFFAVVILAKILNIANRSIHSFEFIAGFAVILAIYNIVVNKFFSPIPFLFLEYDDKIQFLFTNKRYYEMFVSLNKEKIFKKNLFHKLERK